jgi:tetratricopeptide (TPR) repeat protein
MKPNWAETQQMLALACFFLPEPNYPEARTHIRRAIELGAAGDSTLALSGHIENKLGHEEAAAAQFRESLKFNPKWPDAAISTANQLLSAKPPERGKAQSALYFAEQACLATNQERSDFLETMAAAQTALGQTADALRTLQKAIAVSKDPATSERIQALQSSLEKREKAQR